MSPILRSLAIGALRRNVALGATALPIRSGGSMGGAAVVDAVEPAAPFAPAHPPMQGLMIGVVPERAAAEVSVLHDPHEQAAQAGFHEGYERGYACGLDKGEEQGREAGLAEGLRLADAQVKESAQEQKRRLETLLGALSRADDQLQNVFEDDAVEAIFAAVAQIAGTAHTDPEFLRDIFRTALTQVRDRRHVVMHLSPEDLAWLRLVDAGEVQLGSEASSVVFEADPHIELGGCRVTGSGGELDARLERQLSTLRDLLLSARAQRVGAQK